MNRPNGGIFPSRANGGYGLLQHTVNAYFTERTENTLHFVRIRERFRQRASEWFCAAMLATWGLALLHPSNNFESTPAYEAFSRTIKEENMAAALTLLGVAWLVGLIINGARQRVTSTIRACCAFLGGVIYMVMSLGFLSSYFITGVLTAGPSTYALTSALAFYSLYWITIDKRQNG
jgi:hypothetical protein